MSENVAERLWSECLQRLSGEVTRANFETWFSATIGLDLEPGVLIVKAPSDFHRECLSRRFRPLIDKALVAIAGGPLRAEFTVNGNTAAAPGPAAPAAAVAAPPVPSLPAPRLNPRYTFAAFVVGDSNRLAHAAASALAQGARPSCNPLYLFSDPGQGKTHLLQAIGYAALARGLAVVHATAEHFLNDFVRAVRNHGEEGFRQTYRSPQVLLFDDVDFLAGRERTQEEFYRTCDAVLQAGHLLAVAGAKPPPQLPLSSQVRSRLQGGLCAEIRPPDPSLRRNYVSARVSEGDTPFPPAAADFLVQRFPTSIRELQSALNHTLTTAALTRAPVTLELAMEATARLPQPSGHTLPPPEAVLGTVCRYFNLPLADLRSPSRLKSLVYARHVAAYLLRQECHLPLNQIGALLGGRDHSTILHGWAKVDKAVQTDPQLRYDLAQIPTALRQPTRQTAG